MRWTPFTSARASSTRMPSSSRQQPDSTVRHRLSFNPAAGISSKCGSTSQSFSSASSGGAVRARHCPAPSRSNPAAVRADSRALCGPTRLNLARSETRPAFLTSANGQLATLTP